MHSFIPQLIATVGATLGAFAFGNVLSWPSNAFQESHLPKDIDYGSYESWIVSIFMVGAAFVPWVASAAFAFIGKKYLMVSLAIPFIGGWVMLFFAKNALFLLIGRFLTGFAGGAFLLSAPAYTSEIAEKKYSGALGTVFQLMVCCGILFVNVNCSTNWRVLTGTCIVFPCLMAVWMIFMPRSPVFLASKGDYEGARKALQWLRGGAKDVEEELEEIKKIVIETSNVGSVSLKKLFTEATYLKPFGIVMMLMLLQQLSGINYVLSYSVQIFKSAGTSIDECLSSMLIGLVQVLAVVITILIIDRFGRKILLIISELFICISMSGVGAFFYLQENCNHCQTSVNTTTTTMAYNGSTIMPSHFISKATVDDLGFLPLLSLMVFVSIFFMGMGPIPFLLNVELIPPEARALSSSLALTFNWIISFLVSQFVPSIGSAIGASSCYFIFSGVALLGTIFIIISVPETKGKTEEEIKQMFSGKKIQYVIMK